MESALNVSNSYDTLEFLAFTLGAEEYGIHLDNVQELRRYGSVVPVANKPPFIKGTVNLRGVVAPVIDIRGKFNLRPLDCNEATVVLIININGRVIGMIVDSVSDVVTVTMDQLRPAPIMGSTLSKEYLLGLGITDDRMLVLINIDRLMSGDDIGLVERLVA